MNNDQQEKKYEPQVGDYYVFEVVTKGELSNFSGEIKYTISEVDDKTYQITENPNNLEDMGWTKKETKTYNKEKPGVGINISHLRESEKEKIDTEIGVYKAIKYEEKISPRKKHAHGTKTINYFVTDDENKFPVKMILKSSPFGGEPVETHTLKETNIDILKELAN